MRVANRSVCERQRGSGRTGRSVCERECRCWVAGPIIYGTCARRLAQFARGSANPARRAAQFARGSISPGSPAPLFTALARDGSLSLREAAPIRPHGSLSLRDPIRVCHLPPPGGHVRCRETCVLQTGCVAQGVHPRFTQNLICHLPLPGGHVHRRETFVAPTGCVPQAIHPRFTHILSGSGISLCRAVMSTVGKHFCPKPVVSHKLLCPTSCTSTVRAYLIRVWHLPLPSAHAVVRKKNRRAFFFLWRNLHPGATYAQA